MIRLIYYPLKNTSIGAAGRYQSRIILQERDVRYVARVAAIGMI